MSKRTAVLQAAATIHAAGHTADEALAKALELATKVEAAVPEDVAPTA